MWKSPEPRFDVACAISQGGREYQEDAIVTDFPAGADNGIAVLADGMGGHAAGDVASKVVVTKVFSDLKFQSGNFDIVEDQLPDILLKSAKSANECVRSYVKKNPKTMGMGSTVVALVMVQNRMYYISVGDSALYLQRSGKLRQINEDHSLAAQIDFMVQSGLMDPEQGKNHPDRNCLTSVILGDKIARIDCPKKPTELAVGDIIVVSSDGLQYLENSQIEKILKKHRRRKSAEIAEYLLDAIYTLADPDQDNISFAVIKLNHNKPVTRRIKVRQEDQFEDRRSGVTRVANQPEIEDINDQKKVSNGGG